MFYVIQTVGAENLDQVVGVGLDLGRPNYFDQISLQLTESRDPDARLRVGFNLRSRHEHGHTLVARTATHARDAEHFFFKSSAEKVAERLKAEGINVKIVPTPLPLGKAFEAIIGGKDLRCQSFCNNFAAIATRTDLLLKRVSSPQAR